MSHPRHNRTGRNDPCPCGSGKKYKRCHSLNGRSEVIPVTESKPHRLFARMVRQHVVPNMAVVWIAQDVFCKGLTWEAAVAALRTINRESALLSMAMINAACVELVTGEKLDTMNGAQKVVALADYLFPAELRRAALQVYREHADDCFIPLAPQACLAMTEACLRYCPADGGARFEQPSANTAFAHVLLSFHEQLMQKDMAKKLDPTALTAEQFRYFVRNYFAANPEGNLPDLIRRQFMMFEAASANGVLKQRAGKDAPAWFRDITGVTPSTYRLMLLMVMFHGVKFDIEQPALLDLVYDTDEMLANIVPEVVEVYSRLHNLCVVEEQLPQSEFPDWESAVYGMNYLRGRPMMRLLGTRHLCLYRHLIIEKFFGGTVHVLTELVKSHAPAGWPSSVGQRVSKLRIEFGYLFEDHVRQVLSLLFVGPDVHTCFGFAREDEGECDAVIIVGDTALVFEFVHHPWNLKERARGESADFVPHLKDNIQKAGKLCAQINRDHYLKPLGVPVRSALPIVVTSEMVAINEMTTQTWQRDLIAATSAEEVLGHGIVRPVQTLSLDQLENLDRLEAVRTPAQLVAFLTSRAADEFARFSGHDLMRSRGGPYRRLKAYDDAAERDMEASASTLFRRPSSQISPEP
jgi:SEC-C motif